MANRNLTFVFLLLCCFLGRLEAQLTVGGQPVSFLFPAIGAREVPVIQMPAIDVASLLEEDAQNALLPEKPFRFGWEFSVQISPENAGIKDYLPGGDKLWRVKLLSPGALTINLIFSKYKLPAGAQLFIYNAERSEILGALTDANNQEGDVLGTTLISGDEMVVEYYEPANVEFKGQVEIGTVVHGYKTPGVSSPEDAEGRSFGQSGSCNINVNCPLGSGWSAQRNSVVKIVNGGDWCSGSLINNTSNNGIPYLLTANHCYTNTYNSWVYWFNWQSPSCTNPGSSPAYTTLSGASLKARNSGSDFCLLRLTTTPPANYNVYYSGWNRTGTTPTNETCIHHPSGDIKKISYDANPATSGGQGGWGTNHWRVYWDQGVTEGGSSGSPLFDQNKRIIGQLHGGASQCGNSPSNMWDEYGKFSVSWNGNTASKRLRDWLDPTNTGVTAIDGYGYSGNFIIAGGSNGNVGKSASDYVYTIFSNTGWTPESTVPWAEVVSSDPESGWLKVRFDSYNGLSPRTGQIRLTGGGQECMLTLTQFGQGSQNQTIPAEIAASVYPNPSTGMATLEIKEKGLARITVLDAMGREVLQTHAEQRADLDLSGFANGLYFIRVDIGDKTTMLRLSVQR